jgi:hypothetical protein
VCLLASGLVALPGCGPFLQEFARQFAYGPDAEMVAHLRRTATEFLESDPIVFAPPSFHIERASRAIIVRLGAVGTDWHDGFAPTDPYRLPNRAQVEIEAWRQAFLRGAPDEDFWEAPLEEAQFVVVRALRDIRQIDDPLELEAARVEREAELAAARVRLDEAVARFAAERGLEVRALRTIALSRRLPVPVSTDPEGGVIRVLPFLDYRQNEVLGTPLEEMPWTTLVASPSELIGRYFYFVAWPDGRRGNGRIEVRSESPLVFRPDPD